MASLTGMSCMFRRTLRFARIVTPDARTLGSAPTMQYQALTTRRRSCERCRASSRYDERRTSRQVTEPASQDARRTRSSERSLGRAACCCMTHSPSKAAEADGAGGGTLAVS